MHGLYDVQVFEKNLVQDHIRGLYPSIYMYLCA